MRRVTFADIAAVREIDRRSFSAADQYDASFYERIVTSQHFDATAAVEENGAIIGWMLAELNRTPLRIRSVSVHPDYRRCGFGAALVTVILTRYVTETDLLVERDNLEAISLYRRLGFVQTDPDPSVPERIHMLWHPQSLDTGDT